MTIQISNSLFSPDDIAGFLQVTTAELKQWRERGCGPTWLMVGPSRALPHGRRRTMASSWWHRSAYAAESEVAKGRCVMKREQVKRDQHPDCSQEELARQRAIHAATDEQKMWTKFRESLREMVQFGVSQLSPEVGRVVLREFNADRGLLTIPRLGGIGLKYVCVVDGEALGFEISGAGNLRLAEIEKAN